MTFEEPLLSNYSEQVRVIKQRGLQSRNETVACNSFAQIGSDISIEQNRCSDICWVKSILKTPAQKKSLYKTHQKSLYTFTKPTEWVTGITDCTKKKKKSRVLLYTVQAQNEAVCLTSMTRQKSKQKDALSPLFHRIKIRAIKWQKQHTTGMGAELRTPATTQCFSH